MRICYVSKRFTRGSQELIDQANVIIEEYAEQGFDLTLRQLYYQFVARDLLANTDREYKRLGSVVNDARLAGLIDWDAIQDRTRFLRELPHWASPKEVVIAAMQSYRRDHWANQKYRPEVFIEKDALVGVISDICEELDVPYFSCRGYTSQSAMWAAGQRIIEHTENGQTPIILHLGDHDPSGIDMTRDNQDRLEMFTGGVEVRRLALNMDQVDEYGPPPNPAKTTDSRFAAYIELYGGQSWELDALNPTVMADIIEDAVVGLRDKDAYQETLTQQGLETSQLHTVARNWERVIDFLDA